MNYGKLHLFYINCVKEEKVEISYLLLSFFISNNKISQEQNPQKISNNIILETWQSYPTFF